MAQSSVSWFDELRTAAPNVLDVAEALGMGVRSRRFGPCPACGKDEPRHPPLTSRHGGNGWMCAHCKETGDAARLGAWVVTGSPKPSSEGWGQVRDVLARSGWCSPAGTSTWTPPAPKPRVEPPYPDRGEVMGLLRACRPIETVPEVAAWCVAGGLPGRVPAAVLPDVYPWPAWWPFRGRPWRLVASMVDAAGVVRSMHGRATEPVENGKTRWPMDRRATGLLFADPWVGRPMLRGLVAPTRVVVAEGMTDYLAAACRYARRDTAVLGASAGGFLALGMAAIPKSAVVYAWTDPNAAGDRYAAEIVRALRGWNVQRVDLRRRRRV